MRHLSRLISYLSNFTMLLLMGIMVAGVVARLMGMPIDGVTNLSESLLVIAIYLGIPYTQQAGQHVSLEFLLMRLGEENRRRLTTVGLLVPLVICAVIAVSTWDYALEAWRVREKMDGAPFYPIYPPKIAVAVGLSLLWLQLLADFAGGLIGLFTGKARDGVAH